MWWREKQKPDDPKDRLAMKKRGSPGEARTLSKINKKNKGTCVKELREF